MLHPAPETGAVAVALQCLWTAGVEAVDAVALERGVELVTAHDPPALPIKLVGQLGVGFVGIGEECVDRGTQPSDIAGEEECLRDRGEALRASLRAS